jgi:hypothetical protein
LLPIALCPSVKANSVHTVSGALAHSHDAPGGRTESALEGGRGSESAAEALEATENGQPLPSGDGWATINRGLAEGDKVIMLRVSRGQRYIVLSRAL